MTSVDTVSTAAPTGGVVEARELSVRRAVRSYVGTGLRVLVAIALIAAVGVALADRWGQVQPELVRANPLALVASLIAVVAGLHLAMASWRILLEGLGSPLTGGVARRIFFVGQLGKYLPGSVWPVLVQMEMGRAHGVPSSRMVVSFFVSLGLSVLTGTILGAPVLLLAGDDLVWLQWPAVAVAAVGTVVLLWPRVLNHLLIAGLRLLRRPPLERPFTGSTVARATLLMVATWGCFGLGLWLLAVDLGADAQTALPVSVSGYALAFTAGLLFVLAPAGVGVRDALLVVTLAPVLGGASATAVALLSRLVATVADIGVALWAIAGRRLSARANRRVDQPDGARS